MPDIPEWLARTFYHIVPAPRHHLITPDAHLEHDLMLDAVAPLDLAEAILEQTGREVPDAEIERWERVADVVASSQAQEVNEL